MEPTPSATPVASGRERGIPIVGIGASAGGLEALDELFAHMPNDTGMAFVVITHQHPGHTSLLPELLGKITNLMVRQAADGLKVEPNHVYVSPPGGHLAILGGTLHRMETEKKEAPHLPIDYFFRSLAMDQKDKAICIVLSGTGTDDALGRCLAGAAVHAVECPSVTKAGRELPGMFTLKLLTDDHGQPDAICVIAKHPPD